MRLVFRLMADPTIPRRLLIVLERLAAGQTTFEIAKELNRSAETVKHYRHDVIELLGADNTAQAIAMGFQRGILK